jgi:glycogen debranching enzyme
MMNTKSTQFLNLLRNHIDISKVPFSDRGSRLLLYHRPEKNQLYVKLAERISGLEAGLESYLFRQPYIDNLYIIDKQGKHLDFELVTSPDVLYLQTKIGEFGLTFQDGRTISIQVPDDQVAGLSFYVRSKLWVTNDQGGELKSIRNMGYSSNGEIIKNQITPENGGFKIELLVRGSSDCAITIHICPDMNVTHETMPFSKAHSQAHKRWRDWFERVPPVDEPYLQTYAYAWWVMANNLISPQGNVAYEAMIPSKTSYIGLWLWDSAMHTLALRHLDPKLARDQIRAMLAYQLPDGMIPDAVFDDGVVAEIDHPFPGEVTKPPILAWAAMKLHEVAPDPDFLQEIYVPLVRWNAWWFSMNDDDVDGLAQYNHPYSSGLDDNPMWDFGMPVESPDLNTYLCVQMGSLAMMAEALNMEPEAGMWRRRAAAIVRRMIEDFWDEEAGIFRAYHDNKPLPVITPFNLYPLWTGQLPDHIRNRLIDHLKNPEEFWGKYAVPTVARNDPKYDPETMWRGPIWANVNYFFIEALKQINEDELANELRDKTLQLIMEHPSIYEFYNAESGVPPEKAANIFGWTAAVFIDLALQASNVPKVVSIAKETVND